MEPMPRASKYSPEVRERAVRMLREHAAEYLSEWAAIRSISEKLGCSTEALRRWMRQNQRDHGERVGLTTSEREELRRLQRENVELKRAMRSCARHPRFSPRRSSTADRSDGHLHR
jgi:transposase-like protein